MQSCMPSAYRDNVSVMAANEVLNIIFKYSNIFAHSQPTYFQYVLAGLHFIFCD